MLSAQNGLYIEKKSQAVFWGKVIKYKVMRQKFYLNWSYGDNHRTFLVAQMVKNPPAVQEPRVRSLGWEDALEKRMILQYSCLENSMDIGPGGLQSMGSQRVRHNWVTEYFHFTETTIHGIFLSYPLKLQAGRPGTKEWWEEKFNLHPSIILLFRSISKDGKAFLSQ